MKKSNGRSIDGYMEDYNYHDWAKYMVSKPEDAPKGPHFAAVLFDTRSEYSPSYDDRNSGSSYSVSYAQYFAFPKKEILEAWLLRAAKEGLKFFFFEVKRLGDVKLKVSIDVETDDGSNPQSAFGMGRGD